MANISADFVIKLALVLALSTLPSIVYLLIFQKAKKRWRSRLRRAQNLNAYHHSYRDRLNHNSYGYSEDAYPLRDQRRPVTKYFIGDTTCLNNAHSPYIRCAINPEGPCDECVHYEKQD
ncbi:MAG: ABC transporter ATP-binding protein [Hydrococcus sp. SU_1_0]|nr:ABC transporter ATP-binding protein [Hydrococcus sp. SU_1_0]